MSHQKFLIGEWRDLVFFTYKADPNILQKYLPKATEIDFLNGETYITLVSIYCKNTKPGFIPVPFGLDFTQLNLRMYIKRIENGKEIKGISTIQAIVPSRIVALGAKLSFGENYKYSRMNYSNRNNLIKHKVGKSFLEAEIAREASHLPQNDFERFIERRTHGFTKRIDASTLEYEVYYSEWKLKEVKNYTMKFDFQEFYPLDLANLLKNEPVSVLYTEGSIADVYFGMRVS